VHTKSFAFNFIKLKPTTKIPSARESITHFHARQGHPRVGKWRRYCPPDLS